MAKVQDPTDTSPPEPEPEPKPGDEDDDDPPRGDIDDAQITRDDDRFGVSADEALDRLEEAFELAILIAAHLLIIQVLGNSILSIFRAAPRNN